MTELSRREPLRVQLRVLREHLERHGPDDLAGLAASAQRHDPRVTEEMVAKVLQEKNHIFHDRGGVYSLVPNAPVRVSTRRPRPRPSGTRRTPSHASSSETRKPPSSPAQSWAVRPEGFVQVVVDETAVRHASGSRLLVELRGPQTRGAMPQAMSADELANVESIGLFERNALAKNPVYRGDRPVLQVQAARETILVVLGRPTDLDWGRTARSVVPALSPVAPKIGRALALRPTLWDLASTPPDPVVERAARLPLGRVRASRGPVIREAQQRLGLVRDDHSRWQDFRRWIATAKSQGAGWDQELVEDVLRLTLPIVPGSEVVALAQEILAGYAPHSPVYAEAMAPHFIAMGPRGLEDARQCLQRCREVGSRSPELDLVAAQVAYEDGRYEDACELFLAALGEEEFALAIEPVLGFVQAASCSPQRSHGEAALKVARRIIDHVVEGLSEVDEPTSDLLAWCLDVARVHRLPWADLIQTSIRLFLAAEVEETARHEFQTQGTELSLGQRLDTLSLFEMAETSDTSDWLLGQLLQVMDEAGRQPRLELFARAVAQMETVLRLLGREHEGWADDDAAELDRRRTAVAMPSLPDPFTGLSVTLVGGRKAQRRRILETLRQRGAERLREVPPHWEERVDERVIKERCGEADLVVLLTDETGHQEQDLLRKLQIGFCPSQGGPTRVLYELATVLASR